MKLGRGVKGLGQADRARRVMNMAQPMVVANHLCASMVIESARSMPASTPRRRFDASAAPPQAASTWNQSACCCAMSAQACKGSIMPAPVVPAVATTITGTAPGGAVLGDGLAQRLGIHAAAAVGGDQAQRAAADAGLMGDFQPGDVAIARGIELHRSGKGAHAVGGESGMRARSGRRSAPCSSPRIRRWQNARSPPRRTPARRATARITWLSSATGTGEEAELASCGLNRPAMRSAHCAGKFAPGLNRPK